MRRNPYEREPDGSLSSRRRQSRPGLAAGQAPLLSFPNKETSIRISARHFAAMGTSCSLFAAELPALALLGGELWVRSLAARLTRFDARSELSLLNAAAGRWTSVSPELEALLRESLRAHEMSGGLVNVAGDLRARGGGPDGAGWPVGLGAATILLAGQGAATSSVLRRRWAGGLHHLIDPRTGLPAASDLVEVSVVAATAVDAEIVAKAALIAGREPAPAYCAAHADAWRLVPASRGPREIGDFVG